MTTKVEESIEVAVPVRTAYDQWTQFEEFPHFMGGVQQVVQLDAEHVHWVAEIAGVKREWDARIVEQIPDQKVAWAATQGATNAGAIYFHAKGPSLTLVRLVLEFEPEGLVEKVGDALNVVDRQAKADLARFKAFIEDEGYATGAWRGSVKEGSHPGSPGVDEAAASRGDSGKAGITGKAAVAGAAAAVAGVVAAKKLVGGSGDDAASPTTASSPPVEVPSVAEVEVVEVVEVVDVTDVVEPPSTTAPLGSDRTTR